MKKLRVGVWLNKDIIPEDGGGFSYYTKLIYKINSEKFKDAEIVFISNTKFFNFPLEYYLLKWKPSKYKNIRNIVIKLLNFIKLLNTIKKYLIVKEKQEQEKLIDELYSVVDLIYYTTPMCEYPEFPYIYTLWDIGHLSMYSFPEVNSLRIFEGRKNYHGKLIERALMIFTESKAGKDDAIKFYNLNKDRIQVIPIFPSSIIDTNIIEKKPNEVNEDLFFLHYPAQFWAHKNHYNLLIAFKYLIKDYPNIKLIFTGSDKGNKNHIYQLVEEFELKENILDIGFVKIEELKWLYTHSQGLVFPTFLGPTNMPLMEAGELGCLVACSNIDGHKEQIGEYGYYFDPLDPLDIYNQIKQMIQDKQSGIVKKYASDFNINNSMKSLNTSFSKLKNIRHCWGGV